jgi:ABC-type oligopeptide transport system substrate-binding subunit
MKKILALMIALTMIMTVMVAGASAEASEQIISTMFGGGTPLTLDPALNSASVSGNYIRNALSGLMGHSYDADGNVVLSPDLAESYEVSDDGLVYTFKLREGLKWSDGSDFVASQVASSWNRAASPELGADYGFLYDYIAKNDDGTLNLVADDDAGTLVVTLVNPCAYFLDLCAFTTFYPVRTDIADNEGIWATDPATYIGTGPFCMTKYAVDDVITFEKNPYYWNADNVTIDGLNCYLSEDNVAILTAYENDTVQYIQSIDPTEFDRLNATYPGELEYYDNLGTYYVLFNVNKDMSPEGKQLTVQEQSKVRFALGQMVDRYELVTYVTQGGQIPATGFFPAGLSDALNADVRESDMYGSWYTATDDLSDVNENYTVDQVTAAQTLIDMGYSYTGSLETGDLTFSDVPSIEFAFNNAGANALIIQYVQETWNKFGIQSTINTEAWSTLQTKLKAGNAEAARMGWIADFNDVVNFLEIFISNSGNNYPRLGRDIGDYTKASDVTADAGIGAYWGLDGDQTWAEAYDALVDQIKAETDATKRAELAAQAEQVLMATGGVAPLYYYTQPQMLKPNIKNVIRLATGDVIWAYATIE